MQAEKAGETRDPFISCYVERRKTTAGGHRDAGFQ
jgi:hypothetical protein